MEEQEKERKKDKEEIKNEIQELKEEYKRREGIWEQQRKSLEERMKKLEEKVEKVNLSGPEEQEGSELIGRMKEIERNMEIAERRRRRNNIVIKEAVIRNKKERKERNEKMMGEISKMQVDVEEIQGIGHREGRMTLIRCKSWEAKREIMTKRKELGNKYEIFLDDNLTRAERLIQKEIRRVAKEEREAGKRVTIGYQRMWVDNGEMRWNESKGKLEYVNNILNCYYNNIQNFASTLLNVLRK